MKERLSLSFYVREVVCDTFRLYEIEIMCVREKLILYVRFRLCVREIQIA